VAVMDLRPLGLGELLDRAFSLYRRNFFLFFGIAGIPQAILFAVAFAAQIFRDIPGIGAILALLTVVAGITQLVGYALSEGATVYAVSELLLGRQTTIRQSYRLVRGEIGTIIAVLFLAGLLALAGFVLLIVPGVYIILATSLAVPAAVLENIHAREAIRRSMDMTKGHKGRVFVILVLVFVLSVVAFGLFELPFDYLLQQGGRTALFSILSQLGGLFAGIVVAPLGTITFSLLYYDIRVRDEAFDLQMMMAQLDGGPLPTPRSPGPLSILGQ